MNRLGTLALIILLPLMVMADEATDYQVIRGMVRDGAFGIAVNRMDAYLDAYPESEHARDVAALRVAACLSARYYTRVHETAAAYRTAYCGELSITCAEVELHDATAYFLENRYQEAADILAPLAERVKDLPVDSQKVYRQLAGDVAFARNQFDEAVDQYNGFLKIGFDNETRLKLGMAYYHLKKYSRADRVFTGLSEEGFDDPRLYRYMGLIAFGKEKYEDAAAAFDRAGEFQDRMFQVHTMLQMGRDAEAHALFREAVPLREVDAAAVTLFRIKSQLDAGAIQDAFAEMKRSPIPETRDAREVCFSLYDRLRRFNQAAEELHRIALTSDEPGRDFYRLGEYVLTRLNDMERAYTYYGQVLEKDPGGSYASLALMNRIKCSLYKGDREAALRETTAFLNEYGVSSPITDQAYMILGKLMLERGVYPEAIKSFENIVANYPDSNMRPDAATLLIDSYFRYGMYGDALKAASATLGENPSPDAMYLGAMSAYFTGDYPVSVQLFDQLAATAPNRVPKDIHVFALVKAGDLARAADLSSDNPGLLFAARCLGNDAQGAVQTALAMDPQDPVLLFRAAAMVPDDPSIRIQLLTSSVELGGLDSVVGRLAMLELEPMLIATGGYRAILDLEPDFIQQDPAGFHGAQGILKKARQYREKGKLAKAVSMYQMAVTSFPDALGNDEAYYFLYEYARPQRIAYLEKIVADFPDGEYGALAAYKLALVRFNEKRYTDAIPLFQITLGADDPTLAGLRFAIHYYLGVADEQTGNVEDALSNYGYYLDLIPDDVQQVDERVRIGLFFQKNGQLDRAKAEFDRLLAMDATADRKAELTFYAAECLEGSGNLEAALQQYLEVTYLHASELMWSTTARFRAARICEQLEYYDDAIKLYRKIADAHKGQIQGEFARKKLEELQTSDVH